MIDSWGMYNRECVSYTAFKVHMDFLAGRTSATCPIGAESAMPTSGTITPARRYPCRQQPDAWLDRYQNSGIYGHAMYVEQVGTVNGQQAIYVSQYNQQLRRPLFRQWRYSTGLVFLHF